MALRIIRELGDPVLNKPCKEVTEMTPRIRELIEDMIDTMYEANGVGLAAPQVGVLKRIVVIDCTVKAVALDINMKPIEVEGTELLARANCHELDHLDGHLYVEKVEGPLLDVKDEEEEE